MGLVAQAKSAMTKARGVAHPTHANECPASGAAPAGGGARYADVSGADSGVFGANGFQAIAVDLPEEPRLDMSSESPSFMNSHTDYFLLWIVIISGVAIGNLASNFITASYIEAKAKQVAVEATAALKDQTEKMERETAAIQAARAEAAQAHMDEQAAQQQAQRRGDAKGQELSRACAEWTRAHSSMNSYTTRTEMAKHCDRLDRYLDTGIAPLH
jgi:hypothetical protein